MKYKCNQFLTCPRYHLLVKHIYIVQHDKSKPAYNELTLTWKEFPGTILHVKSFTDITNYP